ncbi:FtsX-like permease family protein [Rhodanobacter sp. L36]|uniref:ABC transporter permease n=1 Tax=Rhodanobacter sp. L36 TaxID=1747221 RepID=UPI0020B14AFA|nr:FtsX-like permease family protein [Rhodanobacter sp. L36]
MSWRAMFSTLYRHSLMPLLVLLQVALACAILCNVLFLVWQKMQPMLAPSGVAGHELILVDQISSTTRSWSAAEVQTAEEGLRRLPGVRAASAATGLPMVLTTLMIFEFKGPSGVKIGVNGYIGDGLVKTLGLQLVAGRDFLPAEYREYGDTNAGAPLPVIITQAMANQLIPDGQPVGKLLSDPNESTDPGYRVVGVVRHLLRNQLGMATDGKADYTVLTAQKIGKADGLSFAVRVDPSMREAALGEVRSFIHRQFDSTMDSHSPARISFYDERRDAAFKSQRAALWLFAGVSLSVVIVTVIGIMGLTGFWVQKRTRQIGIRRALGARRGDIIRLFLVENLLIVVMGVAVGMLLAFGCNLLLMHYYELPRLPWSYLPIGGVLMLLLGQLAVLSPAMRAARVPPIVATRSL